MHHETLQVSFDFFAQGLANFGQAASEHDYRRMKQVSDVGQGKSKIFGGLLKNALCGGIMLSQCLGEMASFSTGSLGDELCEQTLTMVFACFADFCVHRPA